MKSNVVADKSFGFAKDIIFLYKRIVDEHSEYVMSKQLLRSGTSIGANIMEALKGQSKSDFLCKMYISMKETNETEYWLRLLLDTGFIEKSTGEKMIGKCEELLRILNAIILTTKKQLKT